jgi:predicted PurR-regulated permease PerM
MKNNSPQRPSTLEDKTFLLLLVVVTLAFAWVLAPFYGAVFWAAVLAILFAPLHARLSARLPSARNLAALISLLLILLLVVLPLTLISAMLVQEASQVYERMQSGEISPSRYLQQMYEALPAWLSGLLNRFGMGTSGLLQERLTTGLTKGSQFFATQALSLGQDTFNLVVAFFMMLYLLFFFLRDGQQLVRRLREAVPLDADVKRSLASKFATVIRATVKGNIVVAMVQGALGGLIFWALDLHAPVLWGVLMAFLSLLPAVGAAVVWLPVAAYLLLTGSLAQGAVLIAFGVLVIGLVDNLLRPILVGKDTKMPDYVVLLSTLGGIALFGLNGFVIGPVIAAMFMAVWDLLVTARQNPPS